MECRLHHLALLLGLLVWAAAAATGGGAQPVCEPSIIATQIALFCMPDMPTAPCCEPIIASIDLGGGVPCLCRVAAQPQLVLARLNATHHLALYASCGGQHTMGAHLAAACQQGTSCSSLSISLCVRECVCVTCARECASVCTLCSDPVVVWLVYCTTVCVCGSVPSDLVLSFLRASLLDGVSLRVSVRIPLWRRTRAS
jgi:hypothetical protein